MGKTTLITKDRKEQILKRIKDDGISVQQAADEHGVSTKSIYRWLSGGISNQPKLKELRELKKENRMLKELVGEITIKLSHAQKKS